MKCVKRDGRVLRVEDDKAAELVKQGWEYASKHDWPAVRETFIKNQERFCIEHKAPNFMPMNGICYNCGRDITQRLIEQGHTGDDELVTGCPYCCRSYCD